MIENQELKYHNNEPSYFSSLVGTPNGPIVNVKTRMNESTTTTSSTPNVRHQYSFDICNDVEYNV